MTDAAPLGFWREVPCGHPPDPLAAQMPDGGYACHCGWGIDAAKASPADLADLVLVALLFAWAVDRLHL